MIDFFLQVIDEADRLLNQSFQNWLSSVLSHTRPPTSQVEMEPGFVRKPYDAVAPAWQEAFGLADRSWEGAEPIQPVVRVQQTVIRMKADVVSLLLSEPPPLPVPLCHAVSETPLLRDPHSRSIRHRLPRPSSPSILHRPVTHARLGRHRHRRALRPPHLLGGTHAHPPARAQTSQPDPLGPSARIQRPRRAGVHQICRECFAPGEAVGVFRGGVCGRYRRAGVYERDEGE